MAATLYDQAFQTLRSSRASLRCSDVTELLESLGFEVREGSQGGHRIFVHDHLPQFHSSSFDCRHGRNPQIKPPYISKIMRVLRENEADLRKFLGE